MPAPSLPVRVAAATRGLRDMHARIRGTDPDGHNLEIYWDIDAEAQERAEELGLDLDRIEMPNADPAFVAPPPKRMHEQKSQNARHAHASNLMGNGAGDFHLER